MGDHAMPRDERVRGEKGRYETRLVSAAPATDGSANAVGGAGARVRLIVACRFDTPTYGDGLRVCSAVVGSSPTLVTLTPERADVVMRLEDYGDVLLGPIVLIVSGVLAYCTVWEVLWHPEGK